MRVAEIMTTPVHVVHPTDEATFAWEQMQLHRVRHLVVADPEGRAAGVVSASDLGGFSGEALRRGRHVAELMTRKVVIATPETTVREAANLMRGNTINCLPVFERGKLVGIVTALDLLELIGRGAERPVATTERRILKDRGRAPRALAVAKRTQEAGGRVARRS